MLNKVQLIGFTGADVEIRNTTGGKKVAILSVATSRYTKKDGEALTRLEDLIGEVSERVPHRAIAQAINVVVFIERTRAGRRVQTIGRVLGHDGERYTTDEFEHV